jgi:hypothetical protein
MLARVIARAHGCEILVFDGHSHILFVGRELHRKTVTYLYGFLCRTATRIADEAFQATLREWEINRVADIGCVQTVSDLGLPHGMLLDLLNRRLKSRADIPAPDERAFKESFLVAFVVAIDQRLNDRLAQSGALVPATKKARDWIDNRVNEGDVRGEDTERPDLPEDLDRRGTFSGYMEGANVSLEANAIEGQTRTSQSIAAPRFQIPAGRTPPAPVPHPAAPEFPGFTGNNLEGRFLMRMRITYARNGILFPAGQVVSVKPNTDGFTYNVMREDLDPYCMALSVTPEYLEDFQAGASRGLSMSMSMSIGAPRPSEREGEKRKP